jgi:hypothetical protein
MGDTSFCHYEERDSSLMPEIHRDSWRQGGFVEFVGSIEFVEFTEPIRWRSPRDCTRLPTGKFSVITRQDG